MRFANPTVYALLWVFFAGRSTLRIGVLWVSHETSFLALTNPTVLALLWFFLAGSPSLRIGVLWASASSLNTPTIELWLACLHKNSCVRRKQVTSVALRVHLTTNTPSMQYGWLPPRTNRDGFLLCHIGFECYV